LLAFGPLLLLTLGLNDLNFFFFFLFIGLDAQIDGVHADFWEELLWSYQSCVNLFFVVKQDRLRFFLLYDFD